MNGTDEAYRKILDAGDFTNSAVRMLGPYLLKSNTIREKLRNTIEEAEINYRSGPLTVDLGASKGPRAGDRFLDVDVDPLPDKCTILFDQRLQEHGGFSWYSPLRTGARVPRSDQRSRQMC